MRKKILILSGSPRKGGNSDLLCDEFMRGAIDSENEVEKIRVAEKKIGFCRACYYCRQSNGICAIKDDMADVLQKMIEADVIVLASPVYFYSIDAQLKAVIVLYLLPAGLKYMTRNFITSQLWLMKKMHRLKRLLPVSEVTLTVLRELRKWESFMAAVFTKKVK